MKMNYKDEMRKLIDLVKQQSFDAPLESTLEDLTTLSTAVKDLSDRITTRTKKSLNPNDKGKTKPLSKAKKAKPFPSVTPLPIPQSKNTPQQKADKLNTLKSTDFNKQRDDFVDRQQSIQPTKPQPPM
jgi:hypothetical protein|tara:strand:- start:2058 stop:2441 length:384 start_codon:yes stop_codon:yes gene_type:complete